MALKFCSKRWQESLVITKVARRSLRAMFCVVFCSEFLLYSRFDIESFIMFEFLSSNVEDEVLDDC